MKPMNILTAKDVKQIVDRKTDENLSFFNVELRDIKTDLLHISSNLEIIEGRLKMLENKFLNAPKRKR